MFNNSFSIIIRTRNEAEFLGQTLGAFKKQSQFIREIIVVDSGSTDKTIQIASDYQAKIFRIPAEDFSYAYSLNVGIEQAKGDYIGVFSGHSIPVFPDFLSSGMRYFSEPEVGGVYGPCLPLNNATIVERLFYGVGYLKLNQPPKVISQPKLGIMGNTNALFPKKLWQKHKFDLKMVDGGEDAEWACYWLRKGKKFILEPRLAVKHSHGLKWRALKNQLERKKSNFQKAVNKYK